MAMVCSAVVTVFPPGVFITTMPRRVAAGRIDIVKTGTGSPDHFQTLGRSDYLGRHLRSGANDQSVRVLYFFEELLFRQFGFYHDRKTGFFQMSIPCFERLSLTKIFMVFVPLSTG